MDAETTLKSANPILVSTIVKQYLSHNRLAPSDIPTLIATVHTALSQVDTPPEPVEPVRSPAVPIRRSVTHNALVCLECGRKGPTLRRHIQASHDLTPDEYRVRWGLRSDYPMSAPAYSERRSAMAKQTGLGQRGGRRKAAAISTPSGQTREQPVAAQSADGGLDPAFTASLAQPRRRRSQKRDQKAAG